MGKDDRKIHYKEMENASEEFERILNDNGIAIEESSECRKIANQIKEINNIIRGEINFNNTEDVRIKIWKVAGMFEFWKRIITHEKHRSFKNLIQHLRILAQTSNPIVQNYKNQNENTGIGLSAKENQDSNKLFELYIALLCMGLSEEVTLDSPDNSKGDNPDIIFQFLDKKWAIACKTVYSVNEMTMYGNFKGGLEQINRASVERGFIIINPRNIIGYEQLWPIGHMENGEKTYGSFVQTHRKALEMLDKFGNETYQKIINNIGINEIQKDLKQFRKPHFLLLNYQAVVPVLDEAFPFPVPRIIRGFKPLVFSEEVEYTSVFSILNEIMQNGLF